MELHNVFNILKNVFKIYFLQKHVQDPNHILLDLPKVAHEGELLVEPENILRIKN